MDYTKIKNWPKKIFLQPGPIDDGEEKIDFSNLNQQHIPWYCESDGPTMVAIIKTNQMRDKLTESDKANLSNCPNGRWFDDIDVYPKVKRANYSLGRLVAFGKLRSKVVGDFPNQKIVYYKLD